MSLLDKLPHTVLVYPEVASTDGYGTPTRVPSQVPVRVRGWMQPVAAAERQALGQQSATIYRLFAVSVPGGPWARVEWDGRDWDMVGEPLAHDGGGVVGLDHMTVTLAARGPASI